MGSVIGKQRSTGRCKKDALAPNPITRSEHITQHTSNPDAFVKALFVPNEEMPIFLGFHFLHGSDLREFHATPR
jgi:hypothetical protein